MATAKVEFAVQMTCEKCVNAVKSSLNGQAGIQAVDVDLASERVVVTTTLPTGRVKEMIESTGRRAVVQGLGSGHAINDQGAAVAMITEGGVQGVTRMIQVDQGTCVLEGTLDGLQPGRHGLCIHELGDISRGCHSCGDVLDFGKQKSGDLGMIEAGQDGRAEFRMDVQDLALADIIGRSMVVHDWVQKPAGTDSRIACGIIARSSGLFENTKRICACDGVTIWDERDRPIAGPGRRVPPKTETPMVSAAHL